MEKSGVIKLNLATFTLRQTWSTAVFPESGQCMYEEITEEDVLTDALYDKNCEDIRKECVS